MRTHLLVAGLGAVFLSGCAGMSPIQVGQTAGTLVGAAAEPGVGAPVGALVGILAGMLVQQQADQVTERRERQDLAVQLETPPERLARVPEPITPRGEPVRVWVDETVRDGEFIAGHFEERRLESP